MRPLYCIALAALIASPLLGRGPVIENVDDLLEAVERADDGVESISATVQYDRHLEFQDDRILRRGKLYFIAGASERKFAVRFETRIVDHVERSEDETIIFDGQWFVEKRDDIKQFIRREVAREDDAFDPLKLGEGPFPIPIGQDKEDILRVYTAEMPERTEGIDPEGARAALIDFVDGAHQLHLVPRIVEGEDLIDIRLWYIERDGRLVPRLARTENARGDVTFVMLLGVEINGEIPHEALRVDLPDVAEGWKVQETRLPAREPSG